ncbi:Fe-S cluster assembly protein SufD, partial [Xanthomonas citri pv. citri]|nr:Fe-S cluster assembly protein SufD [Xanthomonas citri pv. citri]
GESEEPAAQHIVVDAGANSKALVVLRHVGTAVLAQNIEFSVADGANLTVVSLQEWTDDSVHASSQQAKLGRDATFKHVLVSLG